MASSSSANLPVFNSIQDELIYWKNRSQQLEQENRRLMSKRSIDRVIGVDPENISKDPVKFKRTRIDDRYEMDPFTLLPQHCQELILNQLDGMDVYHMTKVSEYWKLIVESDKKAAKKLKNAVTLSTYSLANRIKLMSDTTEYAHARFKIDSFDLTCLCKYSASLETVDLSESYDSYVPFPYQLTNSSVQNFLSLQKLKICMIEPDLFSWLSQCTFPVLKELSLDYERHDDIDNYDMYHEYAYDLINFSENAPNLKHLHLGGVMMELVLKIKAPFRLQTLKLYRFNEHLIEYHAQTLTSFEIDRLTMPELNIILKNLSKLQILTIGLVNYDQQHKNQPLFIHDGITKLELRMKKAFIPVLNLMPSLETVVISEKLEISDLRFMAYNHHCLKEIICRGIEDNLMEVYNTLKHYESSDEINKNIKITYQ